MSLLAKINPLSYSVDAFRQILLGSQVAPDILDKLSLHAIPINALFLLGFSAIMVSAAVTASNKKV